MFDWIEKCEQSFEELEQKLVNALALTIPDASNQGIRCVLIQHDKMVTYTSRQLKSREQNYPTHDVELAVVAHALKI